MMKIKGLFDFILHCLTCMTFVPEGSFNEDLPIPMQSLD